MMNKFVFLTIVLTGSLLCASISQADDEPVATDPISANAQGYLLRKTACGRPFLKRTRAGLLCAMKGRTATRSSGDGSIDYNSQNSGSSQTFVTVPMEYCQAPKDNSEDSSLN